MRMSDGEVVAREVLEHLGAVAIAAIDDAGQVLLVTQYRHPVRRRLAELPAGLLDVAGEPALDAARRELAEEAGVHASIWHTLLDLHPSPGISDEAVRVFLARGLTDVPDIDRFTPQHEELTLTVERVALDEAVRRALAGDITNAAAVAGLLAAAYARDSRWSSLRDAGAPWEARPERAG
ncbi:MAG: NUDIX hydrolase [Actinomycetota bacterium]|nr:NUDIX hydrolase [Actinomycetota bacterium]